jgi:hypothetical protein
MSKIKFVSLRILTLTHVDQPILALSLMYRVLGQNVEDQFVSLGIPTLTQVDRPILVLRSMD